MSELFFTERALECIARQILNQYDPFYLNGNPRAVPLEKIVEDAFGLRIEYVRLTESDDGELGRMIYDDGYTTVYDPDTEDYELFKVSAGTILIDCRLLTDPKLYGRYRYTLAHELAHWVLHKKLFQGTRTAAATYGESLSCNSTEWQANHLAKALLMPVGQVKRAFFGLAMQKRTSAAQLQSLANIFEVSKQAMEYRLKEFGLLR